VAGELAIEVRHLVKRFGGRVTAVLAAYTVACFVFPVIATRRRDIR